MLFLLFFGKVNFIFIFLCCGSGSNKWLFVSLFFVYWGVYFCCVSIWGVGGFWGLIWSKFVFRLEVNGCWGGKGVFDFLL